MSPAVYCPAATRPGNKEGKLAQIRVVYGPPFSRLTGRGNDVLLLNAPTLTTLIQVITEKYGERLRHILIDPATNEIMDGVSVLVNGHTASPALELQDGDEVTFLMSIGGGSYGQN